MHRSTVKNRFDVVAVYLREQCSCGWYHDVCISQETFLPSLYFSDIDVRAYASKLEEKGVETEYEINSRTGLISNRDCIMG